MENANQMLENPLTTGYGMEIMSNGRLHSANFQRYRNRMKQEANSFIVLNRIIKK